jgi:UPF0271 protein
MNPRVIDLNADVGEDPAALASGTEAALIAAITSANIACGGHAGDDGTMAAVVQLCLRHGVAVGAHPSFPDRAGFGRVALPLAADAIEVTVTEQIARLGHIARAAGAELTHVKPHGALYHVASARVEVAYAIARAARRWHDDLILVGQAGSAALAHWRALGCATLAEAFADRRYEAGGSLRARSLAGAVLTDAQEVSTQALRIARGEGVVVSDGAVLPVVADTLCIHSDTKGAAELAQAVGRTLRAHGVAVQAAPCRRRSDSS